MSTIRPFGIALFAFAITAIGTAKHANAQGFFFSGSVKPQWTTTVYFEPRYIAIDIENSLDEPIRLYCNRVFMTEIPAGGHARCRAPEGTVLMQAFKTSSKSWLQQSIHEHRDFIWTMPKPVRKIPAKPELPYLSPYLEEVVPAPKVTTPIQAPARGSGTVSGAGFQVTPPKRISTDPAGNTATPRLGEEQVVPQRERNHQHAEPRLDRDPPLR